MTPTTIFRFLLLPLGICAGFAILAALDTRRPFGRVLALRPLAYLGKLSYSLYLWHLPALMALGVYTSRAGGGQGTTLMKLSAVALSLAAAAASYHLVEQPFLRRGSRAVGADVPAGSIAGHAGSHASP